jgi:hypothetical protein
LPGEILHRTVVEEAHAVVPHDIEVPTITVGVGSARAVKDSPLMDREFVVEVT